ncbi:MAG TPA: asparagine synthase-related protein [Candidatus Polarisedimenticolia bacterium]|jgi:asparagine synthase (glutamine-hydrolysing)
MGGICGWVAAGAGSPGSAPGPLREPIVGALAHRGEISWLDSSLAGPCVVVDSAFNTVDAAKAAWESCSGQPAAFASRLEGSFAAAALDRRSGRLVLARDRLGEKPLYYAASPAGVAFASEIKALRGAAGTVALPSLSILPVAVDAYLAFTYVPAPWTIFEQVRKVPAGHAVVFDLREPGAEEAIRYWSLPERSGEEPAPARMMEVLREALGRRLPPAGSVGCFLSGGLDSSVVAALMAREGLVRFPAFSIGFGEPDLDESAHARRVAELVGADHHLIRLRDVEPEMVSPVIAQLDEPMADAAAIPTWVLAREAAGSARVVMTGDGADALLAGDHWFRRLRRLDALERLPGPVRFLPGLLGARWRELIALLDLAPAARYLRIREKWTTAQRHAIYTPEFRRRVDVAATEATYVRAPVEWRAGGSVDAAVRLDSIHGLPEDLLMKADKMGMAHGVESRSPFLDQGFVEWAARLDIGMLVRGAASKYLLKKGAESLLPRDLIYRRKHGFQVPVARWLAGPLRPLTEAAFDPALAGPQGIFDPAALTLLKSRFERGSPPTAALAGQVWQIVAFQTWWRGAFEGR